MAEPLSHDEQEFRMVEIVLAARGWRILSKTNSGGQLTIITAKDAEANPLPGTATGMPR